MAAKKISVGGRRFLLEWTTANSVALGAGWAVTGAMQRSRLQPYYETVTSAARAVRLEAPSLGIALAVLGTLVGTPQWWCLRRRLHLSAWWVPATGMGWALFGVVMGVLSGTFGSSVSAIGPFVPPAVVVLVGLPAAIVAALLPGTFQGLILRRRYHLMWWPVVSLAGLLLGLMAAFVVVRWGLVDVVHWFRPEDFPSARPLLVVGTMAGLTYAATTWRTLERIHEHNPQMRIDPSSAMVQPGLWATSQTYPSGSAKAPVVPPHSADTDGRTIVPPARSASARTTATSSGRRTL